MSDTVPATASASKGSTICDDPRCGDQAVTLLVEVDASNRLAVVARRCERHNESGVHPLLGIFWNAAEVIPAHPSPAS